MEQIKNVLSSNWKGKYVQGQSWAEVVELNLLLNQWFVNVRYHGSSGGELPLQKSRFDTLKEQNIFSL